MRKVWASFVSFGCHFCEIHFNPEFCWHASFVAGSFQIRTLEGQLGTQNLRDQNREPRAFRRSCFSFDCTSLTVTCISSLWQFANTIPKTAVVQRKICKLKAERVIVTGHIVILYDHQAPSAKFKTKPASCFSTWTDTSWTMPSATLRESKKVQAGALSKLSLNIWISLIGDFGDVWISYLYSTFLHIFFSTKELLWDRSFMISTCVQVWPCWNGCLGSWWTQKWCPTTYLHAIYKSICAVPPEVESGWRR